MGLNQGNLAKALLTAGRVDEAERAARRGLGLGRDVATISAILGEILMNRGRLAESLAFEELGDGVTLPQWRPVERVG